jgi:hypothetical protein
VSVYLREVDAGLNPGALWVRICAGDELVDEHPLGNSASERPFEGIEDVGEADVEAAEKAALEHGEARAFIYDGDSGACVTTIIVRRA